MGKRYLTVRETAEMFQVSPQTVYSWVDRGLLDVMRLGRTIRILPPASPPRDREQLGDALLGMGETPQEVGSTLERLESALRQLEVERDERKALEEKVEAMENALAEG